MLLHVIARGKIARTPEAELVTRYEKRIAWPVRLTELPESGGRVPEPQAPCRTVLLDEKGKDLTSEELARLLEQWRDGGIRECRFVIGAALLAPRRAQRRLRCGGAVQLHSPTGVGSRAEDHDAGQADKYRHGAQAAQVEQACHAAHPAR